MIVSFLFFSGTKFLLLFYLFYFVSFLFLFSRFFSSKIQEETTKNLTDPFVLMILIRKVGFVPLKFYGNPFF